MTQFWVYLIIQTPKKSNMKKTILLILITAALTVACDTTKTAIKSKTETEKKNDVTSFSTKVTEEKRPGGLITTRIIPENQREKELDGSIKELTQTIKDGGLTKTIYYKPDGSIDVDCTADEIWQRIEERLSVRDLSTTNEKTKDKDSKKEVDFNASVILYGFLGLGFIVAIIAFFLFRYLNQNTKALNTILNKF